MAAPLVRTQRGLCAPVEASGVIIRARCTGRRPRLHGGDGRGTQGRDAIEVEATHREVRTASARRHEAERCTDADAQPERWLVGLYGILDASLRAYRCAARLRPGRAVRSWLIG